MKVAFLSAYKPQQRWSTPLSLIREFESRGYNVEIFTTMENDRYTDKNLDALVEYNPNLLIHTDWGRFLFPTLEKLNKITGFKVMEGGDEPQNFERNISKAKYFDLIYTPDHSSSLRYKQQGHNAIWETHFADTRIHFPKEVEEKYIAVCSRGKNGGADLIDTLEQHYGSNVILNQNGWEAEKHSDFLCSGQMVLQQSRWKEITRRIFEAMACNRLVITDRLPEETNINSLFVEGEDIVYYDSLEDLAQKIAYYSENKEERDRIADNGYQKVIQNHTQVQRVDSLLKQYELWD